MRARFPVAPFDAHVPTQRNPSVSVTSLFRRLLLCTLALTLTLAYSPLLRATSPTLAPQKIKDIVIYENPRFHSAFPSVIRRPDGELLLSFRRAPNRKTFGEAGNNHVDPNSQLMLLRSRDGLTWSTEPTLVYADPFGGSQDPCLLQLRDGTLLCFSYGWSFLRPDGVAKLKAPFLQNFPGSIFNGGYYLRSTDGANSWTGPFKPPHITAEILNDPFGQPIVAYNRGAPIEGRDGRLYWACAATDRDSPRRTSTYLLISSDQGRTWNYSCPVATDGAASFNETNLIETPAGDLIAFLRSEGLDDDACLARSTDSGKSFQPWQRLGFRGHPLHALRLPDQRVLLTYGYRHAPLGIRARILNPECTDAATAPEIILRDDGSTTDLGYPWSVQIDAHHVLIAYYFKGTGVIQHLAGTILKID